DRTLRRVSFRRATLAADPVQTEDDPEPHVPRRLRRRRSFHPIDGTANFPVDPRREAPLGIPSRTLAPSSDNRYAFVRSSHLEERRGMTTQELSDLIEELIDYLTLMRQGSGEENGESRLIDQLERAHEFLRQRKEQA